MLWCPIVEQRRPLSMPSEAEMRTHQPGAEGPGGGAAPRGQRAPPTGHESIAVSDDFARWRRAGTPANPLLRLRHSVVIEFE